MRAPTQTSESKVNTTPRRFVLRAVLLTAFASCFLFGAFSTSATTSPIAGSETSAAILRDANANLPAAVAATCFGDAGPDSGETLFGEYYSCDPSVSDKLAKVNPETSSTPIACDVETGNGCFTRYSKNPSGLLPAWRWRDNVGLYLNVPGLDGIIPTLFSFLASIFFISSQIFWWILLEISQWVLTDTLVQDAGGAMNRGFVLLVDLFNASGLFFLLAGFGLLVLARLFLRGRLVKVLGLVLAFIIPIGLMQGLAIQANKTPSSGSTPDWAASDLPTGSPAWVAVSGVNLVDGFTSWFTSGFGRLATISGSLQIQQASAVDPSCSSYVAALYDQYYAYSSSPVMKIRKTAEVEYQKQMNAFVNSDEAIQMQKESPWLYEFYYSQAKRNAQANAQLSVQPPTSTEWEATMANRTSAEKLADARHYKVATVSQLWHRAFLGSWTAAQYGNQVYAAKMYCHQLEWNADISTQEQKAIADVATRYAYVTGFDGSPVKGPGYEGISLAAFEPGTNNLEKEQHLFAWAACRRAQQSDGTWAWKAEPAWAALGNSHGMTDEACKWYFEQNEDTMTQIRNQTAGILEGAVSFATDTGCGLGSLGNAAKTIFSVGSNCVVAGWNSTIGSIPMVGKFVNTGYYGQMAADALADAVESDVVDRSGSIKPLSFEDDEAVNRAVAGAAVAAVDATDQATCIANPDSCGEIAARSFAQAKDAGKMVLAFKGHNPSQRLSLSILALITSVIYVYCIGFLALGSFLAKFGLVMMVMVLPAALLMLAVPSTSGEGGGSKTGRKMLRLTGGFIMSHGLLSLVLGLLLSLILVFESILGSDGGSFIHALIPLAALFIVRQILKAAGLGDLASAQGSLGMPLSAALRTAGKDWQGAGMNKFASLTGGQKYDPKTGEMRNKGLTRLDSFAKRTGKAALMAAPRRAGKVGAWAGRKASTRLGLPEAKRYLMGGTNALGEYQSGLAQRMKSFAGLFSMATSVANIPYFGAPLRQALNSGAAKKFSSFANRFRKVRELVAQDQEARRQMRQTREEWRTVFGKNERQGHEARVNFLVSRAQERSAEDMALRDDDGRIIRDADGKPIYGYRHVAALKTRLGGDMLDPSGRAVYAVEDASNGRRFDPSRLDDIPGLEHQKNAAGAPIYGAGGRAVFGWAYDDGMGTTVLDYDQYKALSPADRARCQAVHDSDKYKKGVRYIHDEARGSTLISAKQLDDLSPAEKAAALSRAVTDPGRGFLTDVELAAVARQYAEHYHLRPGQFVATAFGEPIIAPVMGDSNGNNRLVIAKNIEASREIAAHMRVQYLPNDQKARPAGFTDDQYATYLKLCNEYLGGYTQDGRHTDLVFELTGYTWDSAMGQRELTAAIENKDCSLSGYRPEIPPEVLAGITAASSQFSPRAEQGAVFKDIATARYETLTEVNLEIAEARGRLSDNSVHMDTYTTKFRALAPKLKTVQDKINDLATARGNHATADADVAGLDATIAALEAEIATLRTSAAPADRAAITIKERAKAASETNRAARTAERDAMQAVVDALAANEAAMEADSAAFQAEMQNLEQQLNRTASAIIEDSKRAEELGMQMQFAFKAMRRDKGKEDWSKVDDMIDDWVKAHNNRWVADGRVMRSLEDTLAAAISSNDGVHARLAVDEMAKTLNTMANKAARESSTGSAYHGYIINDIAKLEGDLRYTFESNPEVLPFTRENYMETAGRIRQITGRRSP